MRNLQSGMVKYIDHISKHILLQRIWNNKTQSNIAKAMNCTFQQVQKWESGRNRITTDQLFFMYEVMEWKINSIIHSPERILDYYIQRDRTKLDHIDDHLVEKSDFIKRKWLKVSTPKAATLTNQIEERI
jgi:transcriptional regulator with XRE-family HTH domain